MCSGRAGNQIRGRLALIFAFFTIGICSSSDEGNQSELESISDVESMIRLADGSFQVRCKNGTSEIRSESDILANRVCLSGSSGGTGYGVIYGRSDSCSASDAIAEVTPSTDCRSLGTAAAWSVKFGGQCQSISDTTVDKACLYIKGSNPNVSIVYGRSDSCSADSILGIVDELTSCESFGSESGWSIKVAGQCQNISDTTANRADLGQQPKLRQKYSFFSEFGDPSTIKGVSS